MKYLGTISNSQDIITKGWLIKNVASVIPDGSITASKLAENIETSIMVASEIKNPPLTKSGDTFIWTISATEHGLMSTALSVIVALILPMSIVLYANYLDWLASHMK